MTLADFTDAIERIVAGLEKRNRLLNPREREIVAYHEMGHALVALSLPGTDPVHKVSIIPRGVGALGYTIQRPTEDRFLMTREELENKIAVILGGRAAEQLVFDHLSTGAADDLVRVTDIARSMVTRYGMDEKLGPVAYDTERSQFLQPGPGASATTERRYSEDTAREIDVAVRAHRRPTLFERTLEILRAQPRRCSSAAPASCCEKETLDETELKALTRELRGYASPGEAAAPAAAAGPSSSDRCCRYFSWGRSRWDDQCWSARIRTFSRQLFRACGRRLNARLPGFSVMSYGRSLPRRIGRAGPLWRCRGGLPCGSASGGRGARSPSRARRTLRYGGNTVVRRGPLGRRHADHPRLRHRRCTASARPCGRRPASGRCAATS